MTAIDVAATVTAGIVLGLAVAHLAAWARPRTPTDNPKEDR